MPTTEDWIEWPGGLGQRLRALREAAGLSQPALASLIGVGQSRISRIETGAQRASRSNVEDWARHTNASDQLPSLIAHWEHGQAIHRVGRDQPQETLQQQQDRYLREAQKIREFQIMIIPGLLQTPDYIRHIAAQVARVEDEEPGDYEGIVTARMRRQEILYDRRKRIDFLLTQSAFDYLPCPPDVMAGQIDRLLQLQGMSHITLSIIPPGRILPVTPMTGFQIVDDTTTIVETLTASDTLTGDEAAMYGRIFDLFMEPAITGEDARRLLTAVLARLRQN
jgi:transcriptional regulator with XRE-family HTH domain